MRIVVVGGSASNVGKTALAAHLLSCEADPAKVAMKVSVRERPCEPRILVMTAEESAEHRHDTDRLLAAGATHVVWVTIHRPNVRAGLAAGLRSVRRLKARVVVIESTSAGIELRAPAESWFVAGEGAWKPWADRHRDRADHVLGTEEVYRLISSGADPRALHRT
ncbi:MAG TPA: hypothetical protein VE591_07050 [Candidatus Acidoferrum sp.]|jgi:hypothetical protein|nr:hypothetical protein [Candidatus Acidoferrum sp.]